MFRGAAHTIRTGLCISGILSMDATVS